MAWSNNHNFFYIMWIAGNICFVYLGKKKMAPGCTTRRNRSAKAVSSSGQCSAGKPGIHVDITLTCTTYIVADQVHLFMAVVFRYCSGHFQKDNVHCHTRQIAQEWFQEHGYICRICWTNKSVTSSLIR